MCLSLGLVPGGNSPLSFHQIFQTKYLSDIRGKRVVDSVIFFTPVRPPPESFSLYSLRPAVSRETSASFVPGHVSVSRIEFHQIPQCVVFIRLNFISRLSFISCPLLLFLLFVFILFFFWTPYTR